MEVPKIYIVFLASSSHSRRLGSKKRKSLKFVDPEFRSSKVQLGMTNTFKNGKRLLSADSKQHLVTDGDGAECAAICARMLCGRSHCG